MVSGGGFGSEKDGFLYITAVLHMYCTCIAHI